VRLSERTNRIETPIAMSAPTARMPLRVRVLGLLSLRLACVVVDMLCSLGAARGLRAIGRSVPELRVMGT
jgi:hypothetical protein